MIKKIAVLLVTYNGKMEEESIFKVANVTELEQLYKIMELARECDKKWGIISTYRIQIFQ